MGKNRKWDDPTPRSREKCLEAAKEAAAKVFSRLLAEGKIDPSSEKDETPLVTVKKEEPVNKQLESIFLPSSPPPQATSDSQAFSCEIEINDISYACRNLLTKSVTQDDILKVSGAKVATRGRFMTSEEKIQAASSGERPLYLSVQGPNQQNVDVAVQRISSIIHSMCGIPLSSLSISSGTTNIKTIMSTASIVSSTMPSLAFVQDKLFVGLEHAPPNFNVKQKILGPNGSYLQHIQSETGAKVMLRGRGSGFIEPTSGREAFEPMFIYLQHGNQVGLQHAKQLAQNLLETVQKDYANFQQALALAPPAVNPGTASLLAGLQQPAFPLPNSLWNAPIQSTCNYNAASSYNPGLNSAKFPPLGNHIPQPTYNGAGSMFPPLQMPANPSMFVAPLHPVIPLPPPPPPPPPTQISSVSAALSYYEQYVSAPCVTTSVSLNSTDEPTCSIDGHTARPQRRRFQEKVEDENGRDDELEERHTPRETLQNETMKSSDEKKDHSKDMHLSSSHNPSMDADGFVVPPPMVSLKRKRVEPEATDQSTFKVPVQPKKFQGALKNVLACYGSGSDDDDDDDDDNSK